MKILAFERELPGASAAQFEACSRAEARRAWELYQAGLVRELYFRADPGKNTPAKNSGVFDGIYDQNTAVLVLECLTLEDARAALSSLPFVQQGLIAFDLIPLRPYPGFERLFETPPPSKSGG